MNNLRLSILFCCTLNIKLGKSETPAIIHTPLGEIQGHYVKSYTGRIVSAYEGIPYAKPPVGELRFQDPQVAEPWTNLLIANTTYVCLQFAPIVNGIIGSEDCLYIYIYVPKTEVSAEENLDVIVHIHGGAFMLGAPQFLGGYQYITDRDVVYVSFNYRLGIFGFLSTEDDIISGNFGLKDQVMALKWVQNNIRCFGGNPNSVTITGLSAGGASVHYHYLSPLSKNLFHRGFSQSGTALNMWALTNNPLKKAQKLGSHLNCSFENPQLFLRCMQEKSSNEVLKALKHFFVLINAIPFTPFGPVIEKGSNAFLPDHPYKLLKEGKIYDRPWITSNTKNEGIYPVGFFVKFRKLHEIDEKWDEIMPLALDYVDTTTSEDAKQITTQIRKHYFDNESLTMENIDKLINLFSDRAFLVDSETAVKLHAKVSNSPVYYYFFEYKLVMESVFSNKVRGVAHSDDGRLFVVITGNPHNFADADEKLKNLFMDFISNFAKNSIPTFNGIEWIPVGNEDNINYLHIMSPDCITMNNTKEFTSREFWDDLPINENRRLFDK